MLEAWSRDEIEVMLQVRVHLAFTIAWCRMHVDSTISGKAPQSTIKGELHDHAHAVKPGWLGEPASEAPRLEALEGDLHSKLRYPPKPLFVDRNSI